MGSSTPVSDCRRKIQVSKHNCENLTCTGFKGGTSQLPVEEDDKLIKSMDQNILRVLKVETETGVFLKSSVMNSQLWDVSFAPAIVF